LLLPHILPVFSVVAPCQPGASPVSVRRRICTTGCYGQLHVAHHSESLRSLPLPCSQSMRAITRKGGRLSSPRLPKVCRARWPASILLRGLPSLQVRTLSLRFLAQRRIRGNSRSERRSSWTAGERSWRMPTIAGRLATACEQGGQAILDWNRDRLVLGVETDCRPAHKRGVRSRNARQPLACPDADPIHPGVSRLADSQAAQAVKLSGQRPGVSAIGRTSAIQGSRFLPHFTVTR
jgi:hypothetical protein